MAKSSDHLPPAIDDDHIVMIVRPVEAPVVSKSHFILCFAFRVNGLGVTRASPVTGQADTRILSG